MSFTPMKLKTVSFQLPGSVQPARAATAPARVTRHVATLIAQDRQPHRSAQSLAPPPAGVVTSPTAKPDLIADIFEDTKIEKPRRTVASGVPVGTEESKPRAPQYPETVEMREVLPNENERLDASNEKGKQDMRIVPGQAKVSRAKVIKPHNTAPLGRRLTPSGQITKMVYQIREQTNVSCLDYARWMKHDVAKLREHLVKMEDEIKLASKAKTTLDARVFDVRKCLSVNQQSISAQQKKSHKEVGIQPCNENTGGKSCNRSPFCVLINQESCLHWKGFGSYGNVRIFLARIVELPYPGSVGPGGAHN